MCEFLQKNSTTLMQQVCISDGFVGKTKIMRKITMHQEENQCSVPSATMQPHYISKNLTGFNRTLVSLPSK